MIEKGRRQKVKEFLNKIIHLNISIIKDNFKFNNLINLTGIPR